MKFKNNGERIFFAFLVSALVFIFITPPISYAEENGKGNMIFDFEDDGYWKPGDTVTRKFDITNVWEVECYISGLYFEDCYKEMQKEKEPFDVELKLLSEDGKDKKVIFKGNIADMDDTKINFNEKRYLKYDESIYFEMTITFENDAGNEYQDKEFKYIIYPTAYKVSTGSELNNPLKTGDGITAIVSSIFILSLMTMIVILRRRAYSWG